MKPKIKVILKHNGLRQYKIAQIKNALFVRVPIEEKSLSTTEVRKGESIPEFAAQVLVDSHNTYEVTVK